MYNFNLLNLCFLLVKLKGQVIYYIYYKAIWVKITLIHKMLGHIVVCLCLYVFL